MNYFFCCCSFFFLILSITNQIYLVTCNNAFPQPPIWNVDDETDQSIELTLDWLEIDPGFGGPAFQTRVLGGSFPGPTIILSAGTSLKVNFQNNLVQQEGALLSTPNEVSDPDTANLHFHGGHVTSILPGDDTTLKVLPGESYKYIIPFSKTHSPGIHWIHPHHHGSSSLHVGGGAACAFIVKDPPGFLPKQIENAEEIVMVFQDMDLRKLAEQAKMAGDEQLRSSLVGVIDANIPGHSSLKHRFITINGVYRPTLELHVGKWQRWRIVFAGWRTNSLDMHKEEDGANCEFQLLAKDGIYIDDYPRSISSLPVPPGGRVDVMVRCTNAGTTIIHAMNQIAMTIVATTTLESTPDEDLTPWSPWSSTTSRPDYIQDLKKAIVSDGCSCNTMLDGEGDHSYVNGKTYSPGNYFLHTSYLGAVVERKLSFNIVHSYHQHVYPFQLMTNDFNSNYFKEGDWHDTFMDGNKGVTIRYSPTSLPGKIMVHCHNNIHSDRGMIAKEYVRNVDVVNGACQCDIFGPIDGDGIVDALEQSTTSSGAPFDKFTALVGGRIILALLINDYLL